MVAGIRRLHRISRDNVALKAISLFHFFYLCYYQFISLTHICYMQAFAWITCFFPAPANC
ncbi:hypothetical protein HanPI659440_Chr02g0035941 [Helianthus annuus]|nr:hypothetical protein HanPI659440_Chr02g0035941 [Helianthus annuus]